MEDIPMKEQYTVPELAIIEFDTEDVITTVLTNRGTAGDFSGNGNIHIKG